MSWTKLLLRACLLAPLLVVAAGVSAQSSDPSAETLPEGEGKTILLAACTSCHELREVTKFRGFYGAEEWRDIVGTMVEYGATVNDAEVEVLVAYLARHLGPTR